MLFEDTTSLPLPQWCKKRNLKMSAQNNFKKKKIENAQSFLHALDLKLLSETQYSVGSDAIFDAGISVVF